MTRLLQSTPFRVTLVLGITFILAVVVAGVVAFELVEHELDSRADRAILDAFHVISKAYDDGDQNDLVESVRAHASSTIDHDNLYGLADAQGAVLTGNIAAIPTISGWATLPARALGLPVGPEANYRVFVGPVGSGRLLVGTSFAETHDITALTLSTLAWAGIAVVGIIVAIGGVLAVRAQSRIDGIAATMLRVGQGELRARIPLGRRGDDIDQLSRRVNAALDRLSALVESIHAVSVNIAHDLKTPLNRLAITVEMAIVADARGVSVGEHLVQAEGEIQQINSTFDALLRIAQIEAGARRERFVTLNLKEVLESIADAYADVADERGQCLTVSYADDLPPIEGDRELLIQLSANLVENSMRHCPTGTNIGVRAARVGDRVVLTFADDGPGIPPDEHEKVFERLYRVDKSRTTSGSGLGLSLVRAVSDLHGASIALSNRDPGLLIAVAFPIAVRQA